MQNGTLPTNIRELKLYRYQLESWRKIWRALSKPKSRAKPLQKAKNPWKHGRVNTLFTRLPSFLCVSTPRSVAGTVVWCVCARGCCPWCALAYWPLSLSLVSLKAGGFPLWIFQKKFQMSEMLRIRKKLCQRVSKFKEGSLHVSSGLIFRKELIQFSRRYLLFIWDPPQGVQQVYHVFLFGCEMWGKRMCGKRETDRKPPHRYFPLLQFSTHRNYHQEWLSNRLFLSSMVLRNRKRFVCVLRNYFSSFAHSLISKSIEPA